MATPDLVELLLAHTPVAGTNETFWPRLLLMRIVEPMARTSVVYDP